MKDDVKPTQGFSPAQDGINDGKHFLYLDMFVAKAARAACREPLRAEVASQAFCATCVCENVNHVP